MKDEMGFGFGFSNSKGSIKNADVMLFSEKPNSLTVNVSIF